MKKIYFIPVATLITSLILVKGASAVVNSNINVRNTNVNMVTATPEITVSPTPTTTVVLTIKPRVQLKIALKKTNAIKEIDRRIAALGKLTTLINNVKRLTAVQKETLVAQINIEIKNLEDLKVKINNETDAAALQEEKKSIVTDYKSYALFVPEIEIISHADRIIAVADALSTKTTDAALLKTIQDSKAKAQSAIDLVLPLLPDEYPTYRTTLKTARDMLKTARIGLNTVLSSLKAAE